MASPTTPLADFLPYVIPHAVGCPEPVAEFNLRMAAIEFCERTRCWRHLVTVEVSTENRTIAAPALTTIHEFEEATFDGKTLTPTQFTDTAPSGLTGTVEEGEPKFITQTEPGKVSIYPYKAGTLRMSLFLKPQQGVLFGYDPMNPLRDALNVVPPFMLEQHASALASGALARILLLREAWYDAKMAIYHEGKFNEACGRKSTSNMRGQQRAPVRTRTNWM